MTPATPLDVLIIGAGPNGLALAAHCLRLGLRVRLIEKKSGPSATSKAFGLQYRVSEILAIMGVADRFLARGNEASTINMYAGARRLMQFQFDARGHSGEGAFEPRLIVLPQSQTEALLADLVRERGGVIEWGTEFVSYEDDGRRVVSLLRGPAGTEERVTSSWLVSCEGAHSAIRKQAGIDFAGKTYPLAFCMADVELDWERPHDQHHIWIHPEGVFAAMALPGERRWRLMVDVTKQREQVGEVTLDLVREQMATRTGDRETRLANPTWLSEFRIHSRMVDRYRKGRVFLAGDAAHIHSPNGGQGIVTGVQDVTNLAWKLARVQRGAPEALLDTYEHERLPKAREVLRVTDRNATLLYGSTRLARFVRDRVFLPLMRHPLIRKLMAGKMSQLHVGYRDSPLSRHEDRGGWFARTRLKAGDRAPDVAFVQSETGEQTTLFRLLEPLRPVVLLGGDGIDPARLAKLLRLLGQHDIDAYVVGSGGANAPRRLLDANGDFARIYGMRGEFGCLIRPDDHIGLFQRPIDEARLEDYLRLLSGDGSA
jgi:4,5-epoxidase